MKPLAKLFFVIVIATFIFACAKENDTLKNDSSQTAGQPVLKRSNTSGSISARFIWPLDSEYGAYSFPVYCDGVFIENLIGTVTVHIVSHNQQGVWVWDRYRYSGELIGDVSHEHFKAADEFVFDGREGTGTGHINLVGNNGTHYILTYTYGPDPESPDPENNYILSIVSAICH